MDKQNKDINDKNLRTQTRSFQNKWNGSAGIRIKGDVNGRGGERTEKQKETTRKKKDEF